MVRTIGGCTAERSFCYKEVLSKPESSSYIPAVVLLVTTVLHFLLLPKIEK